MTIFQSVVISLVMTFAETPYISHSHTISVPGSSLPLLFVNQKFTVSAGSIKELNTIDAGRLMRICTSVWFGFGIVLFLISYDFSVVPGTRRWGRAKKKS